MDIKSFKNSWALVTGASSGIGKSFAERFAVEGINLILVARQIDRLNDLAKALKKNFNIQVLTYSLDLSALDYAQQISQLHAKLKENQIEIRILCNNAGVTYMGHFNKYSSLEYQRLLTLNVLTPVFMCQEFLPDLQKNPSIIINVSSQGAFQPTPFMSVYGASKSFIQNFSLALYAEYKEKGIYIQTLVPAPTKTLGTTKLNDATAFSQFLPPEDIVNVSIKGIERRQIIATNAKNIWVLKLFNGLAPVGFVLHYVSKMFQPKNSS